MKKNLSDNLFVTLFLLLTLTGVSFGSDIDKYQQFVDSVGKKLVCSINADTLNLRYKFAPKFEVKEPFEFTAYSWVDTNKHEYFINISKEFISNVIQRDENWLAYLLAHELSHITCRHIDRKCFEKPETTNETLQLAFSRVDELEADKEGFKLLLSAGFSYTGARKLLKNMKDSDDYSGIEAIGEDHPSWTDRLSFIDKERANIWRAMSSFTTGNELLLFEQYASAEVCFNKVTDEFKDCYEAYNNRGYALLMRYLDAFDLEDLKEYNIGQIITGGFYRRPASLEEKVKGFNDKLWWDAIGCFKDALRNNPNLSMVMANLGIAYLLDPYQKHRGDAQQCFDEALKQVETDTTLDPLQKAVIYVNASNLGVSELKFESISKNLDKAYYYLSKSDNAEMYPMDNERNYGKGIKYNKAQINEAIGFNRFLIKTRNFSEFKDPRDAIKFLLGYLNNNDKSSIWWKYSYELYTNLCKQTGRTPKSEDSIKPVKNTRIKQIVLKDGTPIFLSQKMNEVKIHYSEKIPIVKDRKIFKYIYPDFGFELVGGEDVIMIIIRNTDHLKNIKLPLSIKNKPDGSFIGLSFSKLKKILDQNKLKPDYYDGDAGYNYVFCDGLGLAFLIENDIVKGIILVEPPRYSG